MGLGQIAVCLVEFRLNSDMFKVDCGMFKVDCGMFKVDCGIIG